MSNDPQVDLLNMDHTTGEFLQMPLRNNFFQRFETEFLAEPWDAPIGPAKKNNQKVRSIKFKHPISRLQPRQLTTEPPITPKRPKSCQQKNQFLDLGIPAATPTYNKIIQRIIISSPHKSSRKNSTSQYRQKCLQSMLVAQKQNSQLQNLTHSSSTYFNFISQINPVSQKHKTNKEPQFKAYKFKLKNMLN
ncbi:unnamed protein product [Paramecium primaurelia]|uniref:Uncharacterized protein n=2 Tax=Paramecium TaxID=5884 RepID=A0A8S1VTP3_9CILI|nr:unnamed protein product [Paramecium primaurelia]CAD8179603.1 unnamed protein product [Paramecium pentaurelia]